MGRRSVALLIHDGVQALDVAGPLEVLAEANRMLPPADHYDVTVIAAEPGAVRASNGMTIMADMGVTQARRAFDTAIVAGGPLPASSSSDGALDAWLRSWGSAAARYGAVGKGAFALGRAGLLDGRVATVDQQDAEVMAAMFPSAIIRQDLPSLRDGKLLTSAGVTAGMDLALALVTDDHGVEVGSSCATRLKGGTRLATKPSCELAPPLGQMVAETPLRRVLSHVRDHLDEPLTTDRLAAIAGTSTRSLARLFNTNLGMTPHDFVERCRVDVAQTLLVSSTTGLKVLAHRCGFGGAEQMRVVFQRRLGISPAAYRSRYHGSRVGPSPGLQRPRTDARPQRAGAQGPLTSVEGIGAGSRTGRSVPAAGSLAMSAAR